MTKTFLSGVLSTACIAATALLLPAQSAPPAGGVRAQAAPPTRSPGNSPRHAAELHDLGVVIDILEARELTAAMQAKAKGILQEVAASLRRSDAAGQGGREVAGGTLFPEVRAGDVATRTRADGQRPPTRSAATARQPLPRATPARAIDAATDRITADQRLAIDAIRRELREIRAMIRHLHNRSRGFAPANRRTR